MKCLQCDCRRIFANACKRTRVEQVRSPMPECICERVSVSRYSPSPVHDDETLLIAAFHPIHVERNSNELMRSAIAAVKSIGLSTFRLSHSTVENIIAIIVQKMKLSIGDTTPLSLQGIIRVRAGDVRDIGSDGNRSFCIYDTASAENVGHADIFQARHPRQATAKRERESLRELLRFDRVETIVDLRSVLPRMDVIIEC